MQLQESLGKDEGPRRYRAFPGGDHGAYQGERMNKEPSFGQRYIQTKDVEFIEKGPIPLVWAKELILNLQNAIILFYMKDSTKKFKLTIDDDSVISAVEIN